MIFGDKESFAVEILLSQGDRHIFANYCLWVKDMMIGDLSQTTLLSSVSDVIDNVMRLIGNRVISDIDCSNIPSLIEELIERYLGDTNNFVPNIASCHDECTDGFYMFLLEENGFDLLLTKDMATNEYHYARIPKNTIYRCFQRAEQWIKDSTVLVLKDYLSELENGNYINIERNGSH